jgi:hypothetical protein
LLEKVLAPGFEPCHECGMKKLTTTKDVIAELGGTAGIALLTGADAKAISVWRTRAFPWKTYPIIIAALEKRGKTAPATLWGIKAKRVS